VIFWCPRQESNLRPFGPQPNALSTELRGLGDYPSASLCEVKDELSGGLHRAGTPIRQAQ
jgi:hypothetical protein